MHNRGLLEGHGLPTQPYFYHINILTSFNHPTLATSYKLHHSTTVFLIKDISTTVVQQWPAISLHSHHVSLVQWTTRLLPATRDPGSKPLGGLMWNRDSPVSVISLHWWPWNDWKFLWPRLRRVSSRTITRSSCQQCDNPTKSHTALLSRFDTRYLTSFSPCLTGPVDYPFASRHKGPGFKTPGGTYVKLGFSFSIVLLQ